MNGLALTLLSALLIGAGVYLHRLRTRGLVRVRVERGALRELRGRLPGAARDDLADALRGTAARGTIIVLDVGRDTGVVELHGDFDPAAAQRVRNVLGNVRVSRMRGA